MTQDTAAAAFWTNGYRMVDALVTPEQYTFLRQAMNRSRDIAQMRVSEGRIYQRPNNQYAPTAAQIILGSLTSKMSALVGREMLPNYSFCAFTKKAMF